MNISVKINRREAHIILDSLHRSTVRLAKNPRATNPKRIEEIDKLYKRIWEAAVGQKWDGEEGA